MPRDLNERIPLTCGDTVLTGPRAGSVCGRTATAVVTARIAVGMLVCGLHAKSWMPHALARLAYWNRKEQAWL